MSIRNIVPENVVFAAPSDENVSWFYMWGGRSYHMSGAGTDTKDRPNVIQRHSEHIEHLRQRGLIPTGHIYLRPKWNQDYKKLLNEFIRKD